MSVHGFKPGDVVVRRNKTIHPRRISIICQESWAVVDEIEMGEPVLFLGLREGTSNVLWVLTKRGFVGTVWGGFLERAAKP